MYPPERIFCLQSKQHDSQIVMSQIIHWDLFFSPWFAGLNIAIHQIQTNQNAMHFICPEKLLKIWKTPLDLLSLLQKGKCLSDSRWIGPNSAGDPIMPCSEVSPASVGQWLLTGLAFNEPGLPARCSPQLILCKQAASWTQQGNEKTTRRPCNTQKRTTRKCGPLKAEISTLRMCSKPCWQNVLFSFFHKISSVVPQMLPNCASCN